MYSTLTGLQRLGVTCLQLLVIKSLSVALSAAVSGRYLRKCLSLTLDVGNLSAATLYSTVVSRHYEIETVTPTGDRRGQCQRARRGRVRRRSETEHQFLNFIFVSSMCVVHTWYYEQKRPVDSKLLSTCADNSLSRCATMYRLFTLGVVFTFYVINGGV